MTPRLLCIFVLGTALLVSCSGQGSRAAIPATAAANTPAPVSAPAPQVPTSPHPTPQEADYKGCPGEGDGTDPELNRLKNRVDDGPWQPVTVPALLDLRWPGSIGKKHMAQWSAADRAQVAEHNGVPVQTEGYLLQVRQEGPESPNCHSADPRDMDFHAWLAAQPTDDRATRSVVIEFSPRIRAKHPTWTLEGLQALARQKTPVRVSGWTMLDPEHPDEVGKSRGTIWEVHPVMKVETAQPGGGWQEL